ncbi:MAG: Amylopullulanase [Massilia sp.]|nr:Amylopullulanase [Massilia sp.]
MNGWTARDAYAFHYSCDAYYLNVGLTGRTAFKISDRQWSKLHTYGSAARAESNLLTPSQPYAVVDGNASGGANNLSFAFSGAHTIKLLADPSGKIVQLAIGAKTFPDKSGDVVTDPVALSLAYDSRALADKSPFGAVTAGTEVSFGLSALPGVTSATLVIERRKLEGNEEVLEYAELTRISLLKSAAGERERWSGVYRFTDASVYGYYFDVEIGGRHYVYQNNEDYIYWTRERGSDGKGLAALAPATTDNIRRFRQTVFDASYQVPSWAKDTVYYYIFPERFRNGDRSNDPKPGRDLYQDKPIEFHTNWLDQPYRPGSGDGSDAYANNDFFGGDIAGIIEKLDYIAALGANTLYITPMFRAASNHKYDTADYRHIDPAFGSDEDFSRLTAAAARRGIRVIPDASLNHTGSDSLYFDRFGKYDSHGAFRNGRIDPASPYADWYSFDAAQSDPNRQYKGWAGAPDLPQLNKSSPSLRNFFYGAPDSVMKIWLDRGAAGWRMDVAPWVPDDFWRNWRAAVKQHRPDALTIAETWFDASKYFLGDTFDSTMNYIFRNTVLDYAAGLPATAVYHNIELMREEYPEQSFYALMNLLSTHDVARSLHYFGYHSAQDSATAIAQAKQRLLLATFFQMSFPGAPAIYYGDEVGMTGGDDPLNRAGYPWQDLGGRPDLALLERFKALTAMRKNNPVLRHGTLGAPLLLDEHLIVLARTDGDTQALVAMNNATVAQTVTVALPPGFNSGAYTDLLDHASFNAPERTLVFTVPPLFGRVLLNVR